MLTHLDENDRPKMVDVGNKNETERIAIAKGKIKMKEVTLEFIRTGNIAKGNVLATAQIAGIMAAKNTSHNIPMCHPILITGVEMDFELDEKEGCIHIQSTVKTVGKTGVEMEALSAVTTAALTLYDMCKAVDKEMTIEDIKLVEKIGGKSGYYKREGLQ